MAQFNVHFFKERSRKIDLELLIEFFEHTDDMTVEMDETSVRFVYKHPTLSHKAQFVITPKSTVPDIYRLNPKYLDLNFHLEMPLLTPNYISEILFELVKKTCQKFGFHIYNEMFEDVLPFKIEVLNKVYHMLKEAYIDKNPVLMRDYYVLDTKKLSSIYRYLDDQYELQQYYQDLETYVPSYHLLKTENNQLILGAELKHNHLTVFPPFLDYIFYRVKETIRVIPYEQFLEISEKLLIDVPGFIKGTKVMPKKTMKKTHKILKKHTFDKVDHTFEKVELKYLIDK